MGFSVENLNALLDRLDATAPPEPSPTNLVEFVKQSAPRLATLVDRGWPLDLLLQQILDGCSGEKKPSLRTLRTHYKRVASNNTAPRKRGPGRPKKSSRKPVDGPFKNWITPNV